MIEETAIDLANEIRKDHPEMGCRKMYWKNLSQLPIGRDECERVLISRGFRVQFPKNYKRTTYSVSKLYHPNLIEGLEINGINQVWQTDITYFEVKDRFYYLTFIEDVYSRRIVGWAVDYSLWAEANMRALRKALKLRGHKLNGLIHHSDRGSQYIDHGYTHLLKGKEIRPSMCHYAWENSYCERLNGIIKNEYLRHWNVRSLDQLKRCVERAVYLYNNERPHWELLQRLSPAGFEEKLKANLFEERPIMRIYKHDVES
jgi:transposase InsO family protein